MSSRSSPVATFFSMLATVNTSRCAPIGQKTTRTDPEKGSQRHAARRTTIKIRHKRLKNTSHVSAPLHRQMARQSPPKRRSCYTAHITKNADFSCNTMSHTRNYSVRSPNSRRLTPKSAALRQAAISPSGAKTTITRPLNLTSNTPLPDST